MITPRGFERLIEIQRESPTQAWCPKCSRAIDLDGQPASARARCVDCGTSVDERAGERRVGKYRIVREIAHGGMGIVYEAEDPDLRRRVALKILRDSDDKMIQRLHREAAIAAQLQHPNIVAVHEVGMVRGSDERPIHFIAMDYVEGGTMADLPAPERLRAFEDVSRAVHYAHERGVVHRDLKPSNVLVDAERRVCLADFGLARADAFKTKLTASFAVMGTPAYMSPEQVRGGSIGPASDVYSLGVMLYEHLAGTVPFPGEGAPGVMHSILNDDPPPLPASVPRDLRIICIKAMAREPERRYATAEALAEDLRRHRAGEPIAARPPSMGYRFARAIRRHRAPAAALAATAIIGTVAGVLLWNAHLRSERDREYSERLSDGMNAVNAFLSYTKGDHIDLDEFRRLGDRAVGTLFAAREIRPEAVDPVVHLSYCLQLLNRLEEAESLLNDAVARAPDHARLRFERAKVLLARYRALRGVPEIEIRGKTISPLPRGPESPEEQRIRERAEADMAAARAGGLEPHRLALLDAERAMGAGDYAGVVAGMETYLRHEPWDFEAYYTVGRAQCFDGQFAEAAIAFTRYLSFRRTSIAFYQRGIAYLCALDHERARSDFAVVADLEPELAEAHHLLGLAEYGLSHTKEALRSFDRTIELAPDHAAARNNRALCRAELGDVPGALDDLNRAEALGIRTADLYANRGDLLKLLDRLDEALVDLDRAIGIDARHAVAHLNRGGVKLLKGDIAGGAADLETALAIGGMAPAHEAIAKELLRRAREDLDEY